MTSGKTQRRIRKASGFANRFAPRLRQKFWLPDSASRPNGFASVLEQPYSSDQEDQNGPARKLFGGRRGHWANVEPKNAHANFLKIFFDSGHNQNLVRGESQLGPELEDSVELVQTSLIQTSLGGLILGPECFIFKISIFKIFTYHDAWFCGNDRYVNYRRY